MIHEVARDFSTLLMSGDVEAAARKYWALDITSIAPPKLPIADGSAVAVNGYKQVYQKLNQWLALNKMEDISIDGPFVTGDQFALFVDMQIVNLMTGEQKPFSEIVTYTVKDDKIVEERFFYPPSERK
jgi:hypothetical protein